MNDLIEFLKNDCLYWNTYEYFKDNKDLPNIMKRAGLIKEPRTEDDILFLKDNEILSMPLNKKHDNKNAIIISTGSFSPMHEGHIQSMLIAKKHVEGLGYNVIQGVMSLSHDAYVSFKNGGVAKRHISERTMLAYEKINEMDQQDWLKIDRMEGEMLSCAVNFSTVLERIYNYTKYHLNLDELTVFYVYGSDNVDFSNAFVKNEIYHGICIERENFDFDEYKNLLSNEKNIHFLKNESPYKGYSSTMIRNNGINKPKKENVNNKKPIYLIRENGSEKIFNEGLKSVFEKYLKEGIEVRLFKTGEDKKEGNIISLDKFVKSDFNIDTSRLFEISSYQKRANGMISLTTSLDEQIKNIPHGIYDLIDDDSVSGYTIEEIKKILLKKDVIINKTEMLIQDYLTENEYLFDVVDARDFLINEHSQQGLVVKKIDGNNSRVPYIFPEVNLTTRATIEPENQILFSRDICNLNLVHNENRDYKKIVKLLSLYNNFLGEAV